MREEATAGEPGRCRGVLPTAGKPERCRGVCYRLLANQNDVKEMYWCPRVLLAGQTALEEHGVHKEPGGFRQSKRRRWQRSNGRFVGKNVCLKGRGGRELYSHLESRTGTGEEKKRERNEVSLDMAVDTAYIDKLGRHDLDVLHMAYLTGREHRFSSSILLMLSSLS